MILYLNDWANWPTAIIDTQTKNESFIRLVRLYKSMGIKNHAFPLALIDRDLQGIDPHDPDLSTEIKSRIWAECQHNIWYFLREVVRIPPQAGTVPVPYQANRGNIALTWLYLSNIDAALIQPRQTGKSVSTDCLMEWLIDIGARNSRLCLLTKDDGLRKANVGRLKKIRDLLPPWLTIRLPNDADNQTEITCHTWNNHYTTAVAQNSEISANNLGRGLTSPTFHMDEAPFINFISVALPAALAAGTAAREEAMNAGAPYGNIFTTTAGKKDDRDGRYIYDMIHGGAVWSEMFFDCANKKHLREMVEKNGSGRKVLVNITMNHRQLGKTDEWLYRAITDANASGEAADRDFMNIWTSGTQSSPLSPQLNDRIRNSQIERQHSEIHRDNYVLRWYLPEEEIAEHMANGHFAIGMDTSEAVGRDAIALVMTDLSDLSTVAVGTFNETNLIKFSYYVADLLIKYPTTTLVIERKSTGQTIIDGIVIRLVAAGIDPFTRIYNKVVDESEENRNAYAEIMRPMQSRHEQFYDERKNRFGFVTTNETRMLLYTTVLQEAAKKAGHVVRDETLISEVTGLVVKNGRIDHKSSGNDDHVIAWLLCHWFATHGRNLQHYGIDSSRILRHVSSLGRALSEEELAEKTRQEETLVRIEELVGELREATNEFVIAKTEHQIRALTASLGSMKEGVADTISAMIKAAQDERHTQRRIESRSNSMDTPYNSSYAFRGSRTQHVVEYY